MKPGVLSRALLLLGSLLLLSQVPLAVAQQVVFEGEGDVALDRRLQRLLRSGDFLLITRDTLLAKGEVVPTNALVVDAKVYVEAEIAGDLVAVASDVFLRPGSRVTGDVVNMAGGLYPSPLADVAGVMLDLPSATYRVEREPDTIRILAWYHRPPVLFEGLVGFHVPRYDRVGGLSMRWGAAYNLPVPGQAATRLRGRVSYYSQQGDFGGKAQLEHHRSDSGLRLRTGVRRAVVTNDAWILDDWANTVDYFFFTRDCRDYFLVRSWYAEVADSDTETPGLAVGLREEHARSLAGGWPWTFYGSSPRPNPAIDDGVIRSVELQVRTAWAGSTAEVAAKGELELAGAGGDHSFGRFTLGGTAGMDALFGHGLQLRWRISGLLPGSGNLPQQRWGMLGGRGTLHSFPLGSLRGDRLVFVESEYTIPPVEQLRLPLLGSPDFHLFHVVGGAWTQGESSRLSQNLAAQVEFVVTVFVPWVRFTIDPAPVSPAQRYSLEAGIGFLLTQLPHPWERSPVRH